jgi:hypothetical protein
MSLLHVEFAPQEYGRYMLLVISICNKKNYGQFSCIPSMRPGWEKEIFPRIQTRKHYSTVYGKIPYIKEINTFSTTLMQTR